MWRYLLFEGCHIYSAYVGMIVVIFSLIESPYKCIPEKIDMKKNEQSDGMTWSEVILIHFELYLNLSCAMDNKTLLMTHSSGA